MFIHEYETSLTVTCLLVHFYLDIEQDLSKGGAVETGCSDLYDVIY